MRTPPFVTLTAILRQGSERDALQAFPFVSGYMGATNLPRQRMRTARIAEFEKPVSLLADFFVLPHEPDVDRQEKLCISLKQTQ